MSDTEHVYRHKKRGTEYRILSTNAELEATGETMVVYQDIHDSKVWVRPRSEFFDGRFERITP